MRTNILQARKALLALFAMLIPLLVNAQTKVEIAGIRYNLDASTQQAEVITHSNGIGYYSGSITIPTTVTHEGNEYSVTSIGRQAFIYCQSLTSITLPEGVTLIGSSAFSNCNNLVSITIPGSVTKIGENAFYSCNSLNEVHICSIEAWCNISFENAYSNPFLNAHNLYLNGELVTELIIPDGVTEIGEYAFSGCLISVTIPESVIKIGGDAFYGTAWYDNQPEGVVYINKVLYAYKGTMPENTSIEVREGTISISPFAFYRCSGLTSITIPEGVIEIGDYAFQYCNNLSSITIPKGVTKIGRNIFDECSRLTSIAIPESVIEIGDYAFQYCYNLTSITIPKNATKIGRNTFYKCSRLISIALSESLTEIGIDAFGACRSLTNITIPKGVIEIGNYAFFGCDSLAAITCEAAVPPVVDWNTFGNIDRSIPVYVPATSVEAYQTVEYWSEFNNIIPILGQCATPTIRYENGKVKITCETKEAVVKTKLDIENDMAYESLEFDLIPTYTLTAYATKDQYEDSDVATLTICWIPCDENHDETTGCLTIPSKPVLISTRDGVLTLSGLAEDTTVTLYTTDGAMVAQQQSNAGEARFTVDTNQVYIVHIGDKVVKIGL